MKHTYMHLLTTLTERKKILAMMPERIFLHSNAASNGKHVLSVTLSIVAPCNFLCDKASYSLHKQPNAVYSQNKN